MTDSNSPPYITLVTTGDEILGGFVQDADTQLIASYLRPRQLPLARMIACGDDQTDIADAISEALETSSIVLVTGGLGPTHDDVTSAAVAQATGCELEVNSDAHEMITRRQDELDSSRAVQVDEMTRSRAADKQATMPAGAQPLQPSGTAPGYLLQAGETLVCVLPGPPGECMHALKQAFDEQAMIQRLDGYHPPGRHETTIHGFGVPEPVIVRALADAGHEDTPECSVILCAREGLIEATVAGSDEKAVGDIAGTVESALDEHFIGRDVEVHGSQTTLAAYLYQCLEARNLTVATAESCTAGGIAAAIGSVPGASSVLCGGTIAYSRAQKQSVLGLPADVTDGETVVTQEVAEAMAAAACEIHGADVGIGITGLLGPDGDGSDVPVGTVWIAWCHDGSTYSTRTYWPKSRTLARQIAINAALAGTISLLGRQRISV